MFLNMGVRVRRMKKTEITSLLISVFVIAGLFILASYYFSEYESNIEGTINENTFMGMFFYVFVFVISIVFAPISALPLIPIAVNLWDIWIATLLSTLGWTAGAMVAFGISRKFGRPYVEKILPIKKMEKLEKLVPEENIFLSILFFRMVLPFDGLSYILGLFTHIRWRTFFWATFLGLIPFCLVVAYIGSLPTMFLVAGAGLALIIFVVGVLRRNNRKL